MKYEVTLLNEQHATVEVETDERPTRKIMTDLALLKLDESGGAEWETDFGDVEWRKLP